MRVLIKGGQVIDPSRKVNDKLDILIEDGVIKEIKKKIEDDTKYVIDATNLMIAPGFVDLHANFCDPGVTTREDLKTGSFAAAKGGFTTVLLGTENKPLPSQVNVIEYINKNAEIMPIKFYPSATITQECKGEELADLHFLFNHGAYGFFDSYRPIKNKQLLLEAMNTIKQFNVPVSIYCTVRKNKITGINEGKVAEKLGLKNCDMVTYETADLKENIDLALKSGCVLDIAFISAKDSVDIVKKAKQNAKNIFVEVPVLNLLLTEKDILKLDNPNLGKVLPPLRTEIDRKALINAVIDNTIDIIATNHMPRTAEEKKKKFKDSDNGYSALETALGVLGAVFIDTNLTTWDKIIEKITINPAKLFGFDQNGAGSLNVGKPADMVIFDPNEVWEMTEKNFISKSKQTPLLKTKLRGRVKHTICNGRLVYDFRLEQKEEKEGAEEEKKTKKRKYRKSTAIDTENAATNNENNVKTEVSTENLE